MARITRMGRINRLFCASSAFPRHPRLDRPLPEFDEKFGLISVGAVYDRAVFLESGKYARS